jgi:hypothetical protein
MLNGCHKKRSKCLMTHKSLRKMMEKVFAELMSIQKKTATMRRSLGEINCEMC